MIGLMEINIKGVHKTIYMFFNSHKQIPSTSGGTFGT